MVITVKEDKLSDDGRFLLRAARVQSARLDAALQPDERGRISLRLWEDGSFDGIAILTRSLADGSTDAWLIPADLREQMRNLEIGPYRLINRAGRALRNHLSDRVIYGFRWNPQDWLEQFGERFSISSLPYVQQMCRGQLIGVNGRQGKQKPHKARLPSPFRSFKEAERWYITV